MAGGKVWRYFDGAEYELRTAVGSVSDAGCSERGSKHSKKSANIHRKSRTNLEVDMQCDNDMEPNDGSVLGFKRIGRAGWRVHPASYFHQSKGGIDVI